MGRILCIIGCAAFCLLGSLKADAQSLIWAIRGTHNTVYLAGSVHLLRPEQAALPAVYEQAYEDAEALVMELDLDNFDALAAQGWMLQHGMFQGDVTLREVLGEERYKRVAAEAQRLGFLLDALPKIEPWALALSLVELQYVKLGFDPEQGVERQLERRARQDGKEIHGLETLAEQLGQLDALTYEQQSRFLDMTVEEMHEIEEQTDELLAAWRNGDAEALAKLLAEEYDEFPELYDALVTERNKRWIPRIEELLKEKDDYLVVVGALHLVGDNGLLELGARRGWKAQMLMPAVTKQ